MGGDRGGDDVVPAPTIALPVDSPLRALPAETPALVVFLRSFGCDIFQGYLYSEPLEMAPFIERMRRETLPLAPAAVLKKSA